MIQQRDITRITFSLSLLIQSNNKRISYYKSAAEKTDDDDLKSLFKAYADQSQHFSQDLTRWVKAYGSTPAPVKKTSLATQAWARFKNLLEDEHEGMTTGAIERDTLKVYKTVLALSFVPGTVASDIHKHVRDLERARDMFDVLRTEAKVRNEPVENMVAA